MSRKCILIAALVVAAAVWAQPAGGPALGKWQFTGKDNAGLAWKGTLSIEKLDPDRFDAQRFHSMCSLEVESTTDPSQGTRGVEAPCKWEPDTRTVSFTTGRREVHLYTAVLEAGGKSLTQGKWTETESGKVVRSGTWSAKLP